jgi:hypothetical protein
MEQIYSDNYILYNYVGKGKGIQNHTTIIIAKFLYEYISTIFGCPSTIDIDQGVHFINDTIKHLIEQFLLKHVSSTTYYP